RPRADAGPGTGAGAKREAPVYGPNLRASCRRLEGDPLEVAQWLQACHDAGMEVRVQVNESITP
ncbi:hypothetical protein BMU53_24825, partial [Salmonella enterica subsp. enterica serovar Kentucky]|nr:hypothetical protein [Salmonella enterica subsp. enterica serovar Kentucky]